MEGQLPTSIQWLLRGQWTPQIFKERQENPHLRRKRAASHQDIQESNSSDDERVTSATINGVIVVQRYDWDTDKLYIPGYNPRKRTKCHGKARRGESTTGGTPQPNHAQSPRSAVQ